MKRLAFGAFCIALLIALPVPAQAQAPGPYYARGTFYCAAGLSGSMPPDTCYGYGAPLQLFDDGVHSDGAAADGVWGVDVVCNQPGGLREFKIANAEWTFAQPTSPGYELQNGRVWTSGPGDVVHFRLDFTTPEPGWVPAIGVAHDHPFPAGSQLELMGSAPELGAWSSGLIADHVGTIWQVIATIATPGSYEFKFRVVGTWNISNFGRDYNNNFGRNGTFVTTAPNTEMIIQFNELTGRIRAVPYADTPVTSRSWGLIKALYR